MPRIAYSLIHLSGGMCQRRGSLIVLLNGLFDSLCSIIIFVVQQGYHYYVSLQIIIYYHHHHSQPPYTNPQFVFPQTISHTYWLE